MIKRTIKSCLIAFTLVVSIPGYASSRIVSIADTQFATQHNAKRATLRSCVSKGYKLTYCSNNKSPKDICPDNNRYFKSCECDNDKYKYDESNCNGKMIPSGQKCEDKSEKCLCNFEKYKFDKANCFNPASLGGDRCLDRYSLCTCAPEYKKTCAYPLVGGELHCNGKNKSCICPSSFKVCEYGPLNNAKACKEENGIQKYTSCITSKTKCEDMRALSYVPNGQTCSEVKHGNKICYENCKKL